MPLQVLPDDRHNRTLVGHVHPPDWRNPEPKGPYDLVVIGAGTAGLITALVASSLGAQVALVERHLMGGDCLNVGCVPSKTLIRSGRLVAEARRAAALGLPVGEGSLDFGAAMERLREIRARLSHEDSAERYHEEFGVAIHFGEACFTGPRSLQVDGRPLPFRRAVIATGARAAAPPVPGLAEAGYLDNESVFTLTERPARLAVIGAGPIGCELAQTFQRLGSQVTLLELAPHILIREDADAARIVETALRRDGVSLCTGIRIDKVEHQGTGKRLRVIEEGGQVHELAVDEVLVGAGRAPNLDLGLDAAGVAHDPRQGVQVDDFLRTTNTRIFAAGDVCMAWKFTHAADAAAKIVVQNALFALGPFGRKRLSKLVMPWCTYTDPEIAHVGLSEQGAVEQGLRIDTYQVPISRANRAVTDGEEAGLVKVHVRHGSDRIVGATVVASHAGELIPQLSLAIQHEIGLGAFSALIYPYPTQGEAIKAVAGAYTRTRLTPFASRLLATLVRLRRLGG